MTYDAKDPDTSFPPIEPLRPPAGAPNVLVVLIDDVGFGASSAFGGPINTPTAERLAADGLEVHPLPHHRPLLADAGGAADRAQPPLGRHGRHHRDRHRRPRLHLDAPQHRARPLAKTLKLNGYSTAQFGKCHEVPVWETSPMGPFDDWPTGGGGFENFYGFIGGETNQWYPALFEGTVPVEPDKTPEEGYHFTEDMTDKAIDWIRQQKALMPRQALLHLLRARRDPRPAPRAQGVGREVQGQVRRGLGRAARGDLRPPEGAGRHPADAELTPRHEEIPAWDDMPEELKPVLRRQMEVYAGFLEHTDHHVGRLVDALADLEILDDTLIYYIIGDNGASAEGTLNGTFNEMINFNGAAALETPEFMIERLDELGGPDSYNHYAVGWAHAMDTPYQWTKQVASHWGGTRNGTIVHWPNGIQAKGEVRNQFHHVIDVAPTILEAAGLPEPISVNGVQQTPMEGMSMVYTFDDAGAADRHDTQYFEMFGNRGIYHQGWTAVTRHTTPWVLVGENGAGLRRRRLGALRHHHRLDPGPRPGRGDAGEAARAAAAVADRGDPLQRPAAGRPGRRAPEPRPGRPPDADQGQLPAALRRHGRLAENSVVNIKNKSHAVTAEVVVPEAGAEGVIIAQGGNFGGWSLYAKEGKLKYCYNFLGLQRFYVEGDRPIPAGRASGADGVRLRRRRAGQGRHVALYLDGDKVGEGRVDATAAMVFSADDTCDVGVEGGAVVSEDYGPRGNEFTGEVNWVQIDLGDDAADADHLITPEERLRVAMARQ